MNNDLITTAEAAEMLGLKEITLRIWRSQKKGPKWVKYGEEGSSAPVYYRRATVQDWIDKQERQSIPEESAA